MKTNMTSRPPTRYSPRASKGRLRPSVTKIRRVAISATWPRKPSRKGGVLVVMAQTEHVHVTDHEAHHEGSQVGRPAERLGGEVRQRDDGEDGHPRRLVPDTGPRGRGDRVAEDRTGEDPDDRPQRELLDELQRRAGEGEPAGLDDTDEG
jgi:hypothetical protein